MIGSTIEVCIPKASLSLDAGYTRVAKLVDALGRIHPALKDWYLIAAQRNEEGVPFRDQRVFLATVAADIAADNAKYPAAPPMDGFSALMSIAQSDKTWRNPGRAVLHFNPVAGAIDLQLVTPIEAYGPAETQRIVREALLAIAELEPLTFAATNVKARKKAKTDPDDVAWETYKIAYQAFPHRRFFGWMGFVPKLLKPEDVPDAAEVIPIGSKGSVIVAVNEPFDLHDPAHIQRANQVEMDLADLDLLPVTDPSLM